MVIARAQAVVSRADHGHRRFRWPARLAALLGRVPDGVLAARAGVAALTVAAERRRLGIPPFTRRRARIKWTASMDSLLGTDKDASVAEALGISRGSVTYRRLILGIPAFTAQPWRRSIRLWTPKMLAALGKDSDPRVAMKLGLPWSAVWRKRTALGVPSHCRRPVPTRWPAAAVRLLGRRPDPEVARQVGASLSAVRRKRLELRIPGFRWAKPVIPTKALKSMLRTLSNRELRDKGLSAMVAARLRRRFGIRARGSQPPRWNDAIIARLGRQPDSVIARELGINPSSVLSKRKHLGIKPWVRHRWTAAQRCWLGRISDRQIARHLGVSNTVVKNERLRLGIAAFVGSRAQ